MKVEIDLPERVPVMTLPEVAFFPNVMIPLFIFEPRYRTMLRESLESHRMFALAGIDTQQNDYMDESEPAHKVATLGIIRGCRTQKDGTSQLILQGLSRVHLDELLEEKPYREAIITPLKSSQMVDGSVLMEKRNQLMERVEDLVETNPQMPRELIKFMESMDEPEDFVDLVAFTFVQDSDLKQQLLETLLVEKRFDILIGALS